MKLEQAIRSKEITDVHLKALLEIVHTSSWLDNKQSKYFAQFNLSPQQYNILRILRGSHPQALTVQDIKSRMIDNSPHTTRMIDKLELNQFALRIRSKDDRRKIFVHITISGLQLMEKIDAVLPHYLKFMHCLDHTEAQSLSFLLEKLRSNS